MPKSLYLIDGHAQIFRAYFAPFRDLTSPTGEPTKATFVFVQMLMNLVERRKPDYLAMVIDTGDERVFRKQIFPEYKAHRESPPDDFYPQEQRIMQVVRDAGVPIFGVPGFEADDLLATMSDKVGSDVHVFLVSRDKDLRQLLSDNVTMYDVMADENITPQSLREKHGFGPEQAVEIQTLMGDSTDNVPGIPGVGPKTAVELINKYGNVENVLANISKLKPKQQENFNAHRHVLEISRQLVTLRKDVPLEFDLQKLAWKGFNVPALKKDLTQLGFTSLANRLSSLEPAPVVQDKKWVDENVGLFGAINEPSPAAPNLATSEGCDYTLVNTPELFESFLKQLRKQKRFAFDTETDDLGAMKSNCIGMSFSWNEKSGYYVAVAGPSGAPVLDRAMVARAIKPIMEDPAIAKIGHNIKYDLLVMRCLDVRTAGVKLDTMIAAALLEPARNSFGIDSLALSLLNFKKIATEELIGKGKNQISMDRIDPQRVSHYACEDADITWRLGEILEKKLDEIPAIRKLCDTLETPLINVLVEMEFNGISVDPQVLKEQSARLAIRIDDLRVEIIKQAGTEFNLDSPRQLGEVLFDRLKLRVVKKTKTGYSTDVEVLEKLSLDHPVPRLMLEYRSLTKLKNTYLDNLTAYINSRTHRIHASFSQIGAETGRLSCSDPNLQNIPIRTEEGRAIRLAFVPQHPQTDVLLTADYSQIELRVLAHFTQEPALVKAFEENEDIHKAVAAEVFRVDLDKVTKDQRAQAKIINFGIIYGVTASGLARRIDGMNTRDAQKLIDDYNKRFPSIYDFLQLCIKQAQEKGYVQTIMGRRRPIPDIASGVIQIRNASERMAINSVVQGSAADLIKEAMLRVHAKLQTGQYTSRMLLQVHDELVFETPLEKVEFESKMIVEEMQNAIKLKVPVRVEAGWGKNWQEGK